MNSKKVLIKEGENPNLDGFNILKRNTKKNSLFKIKIIIFFFFIIIFFLLINLEKFNYIIKFSDNKKLLYMLRTMEVLGYNKIRIGNKTDGGYIILDDLKNIKIAYCFGIDKEISFEKELADKNIDIFMYDHTINSLPFENSKFHWKKLGLCGKNITKINMITLPELIKENGHSKEENMILKMDIESYEWEVLQDLPINIIKKFKYIVGEFHFNDKDKLQYYNIFKKIQITHQIFHIHCNNCGDIINLNNFKICNPLEISFIQKEGYNFTKDYNNYPIENLDYKNCENKADISYIINLIYKYANY